MSQKRIADHDEINPLLKKKNKNQYYDNDNDNDQEESEDDDDIDENKNFIIDDEDDEELQYRKSIEDDDDDKNIDDDEENELNNGTFLEKKKFGTVQIHNDISTSDNDVENELYRIIYGNDDEIESIDQRLSQFQKEDWELLCDTILKSKIDENTPSAEFISTFRLFYEVFCFKMSSHEEVVKRVQSIYPNVHSMNQRYEELQKVFNSLHKQFIARNMMQEDSKISQEIDYQFTLIAMLIKYTYEVMLLTKGIQHGTEKNLRTQLQELTPSLIFEPNDLTQRSKTQQMIFYCWHKASIEGYRKRNGAIYAPKYNSEGEFVHSYEYKMEIEQFVSEICYPISQNAYWFDCLTHKPGAFTSVVNTLKDIKSEWLPKLERNREIFAFRNGLFVITLNAFFYYKKIPGKNWVGQLTGNTTAIKYHDQDFDEEGMERDMARFSQRTFLSIDMYANKFFESQGFNAIERLFILGLLGRMLFRLGYDNWGVYLYFLGLAGTGKSSLLRLLAQLLEPTDVGILGNRTQENFALESIYDKLMYMALDIDDKFNLDQATFLSMCVGEEVLVQRKHKTGISYKWDVPGASASNRLPGWKDNGGSLARRLVIIDFTKLVTTSDPNLFEKALTQKDRFLKVIVSAYHYLRDRYGGQNIKDVLPERFKKSEKKALQQLNPIVLFLDNCCEIDQNINYNEDDTNEDHKSFEMPIEVFKNGYSFYCKKNHISYPFEYYNYKGPLLKKGIRDIERNSQVIFVGVKFNETFESQLTRSGNL